MQRRITAAVLLCVALPAAAWGISSLRAKREADAFYAWRSSATTALLALTKPATMTTRPKVQGSDNTRLIALAQSCDIILARQGDVLRFPTHVLVELDKRAVLACVAGPIIEDEAMCMVLDERGEVSFVVEGMLRDAMQRATKPLAKTTHLPR